MSENQIGIKFFNKSEHKVMFDSGKLFTRHVSYYREKEAELGEGRGDSTEGVLEYKDPNYRLTVSIPLLSDQHIFSFALMKDEWYEVEEGKIHIHIPAETSQYFLNNYGKFFSIFKVSDLIDALNNKIIDNNYLAYMTHFKVDYVPEYTLNSGERFAKLNAMMDEIETLENDYNRGKPLLDNFYKEYMGAKSTKHQLENEMRVVIGIWSKEPSVLNLK